MHIAQGHSANSVDGAGCRRRSRCADFSLVQTSFSNGPICAALAETNQRSHTNWCKSTEAKVPAQSLAQRLWRHQSLACCLTRLEQLVEPNDESALTLSRIIPQGLCALHEHFIRLRSKSDDCFINEILEWHRSRLFVTVQRVSLYPRRDDLLHLHRSISQLIA